MIILSVQTCLIYVGCWFDSQQQIRDLHIAEKVEDIGFYAGFVGMDMPNDDSNSKININSNTF